MISPVTKDLRHGQGRQSIHIANEYALGGDVLEIRRRDTSEGISHLGIKPRQLVPGAQLVDGLDTGQLEGTPELVGDAEIGAWLPDD